MSDRRNDGGLNGRTGAKLPPLMTAAIPGGLQAVRGRTGGPGSTGSTGRRQPNSAPLPTRSTATTTTAVPRDNNANHRRGQREGESRKDEATRLNSEVVRRQDPGFVKIIRIASQVALYEYDCQGKKWESVGISGCLFLYERSHAPTNGLFILNRNSLNNFVQLLTPDIELQLVMPHILMNNHQVIRCLWFYNESECIQITNEMTRRLGISLQSGAVLGRESPTESDLDTATGLASQQRNTGATNVILNMLLNPAAGGNQEKEPESRFEVAGASSLMSATGMETVSNGLESVSRQDEELGGDSGWEDPGMGGAGWPGKPAAPKNIGVPNLFSSKLEMPVFEFPEERDGKGADAGKEKGAVVPGNLQSLGDELRATLGIHNKRNVVDDWMQTGDETNASPEQNLADLPVNLQNLNVADESSGWVPDLPSNHYPPFHPLGNQDPYHDSEELSHEEFERKKREIFQRERREAAFRELSNSVIFDTEPTRSGGDFSLQPLPQTTCRNIFPQQQQHQQEQQSSSTNRRPIPRVLNKDQMVQALTYLLKTDADFTDKLHQAYLMSCSKD